MKTLFPTEQTNELDELLKLNNEQLQSILKDNDPKLQISKMYLYLKGKELPKEVEETLKQAVNERKSQMYYVVKHMLSQDKFLKSENAVNLMRIVANAKKGYQARYAYYTARDTKSLSDSDALNYVEAAAWSNSEEQAKYVCYTARSTNLKAAESSFEVDVTEENQAKK